MDVGRRPDTLQHELGIAFEVLVGADEVVVDGAGLAQVVYWHPVLVHALRVFVQQVTDELCESHIVSRYRCVLGETFSVSLNDLHAVLLLVGLDLAELVPVGRQQAFGGLPHKHKLEVMFEAVADLLGLQGGQEQQVALVIHLDADVHALQSSAQNLQDPLPVGAGHLGDVAVQEAVLVVHQDVLQQRLPLQRTQGPDAVGHVLLAAHCPDGPVTDLLEDLNKKTSYCIQQAN